MDENTLKAIANPGVLMNIIQPTSLQLSSYESKLKAAVLARDDLYLLETISNPNYYGLFVRLFYKNRTYLIYIEYNQIESRHTPVLSRQIADACDRARKRGVARLLSRLRRDLPDGA